MALLTWAIMLTGQPPVRASQQAITAVPTVDRSIFERAFTPGSIPEAAERALARAEMEYRSLAGRAEVVVAEPILSSQLGPLGLLEVAFADNNPPLALIVVRGDFGFLRQPTGPEYMGYLFDMCDGGVMTEQGGLPDSVFSRLLSDPNLLPSGVPSATVWGLETDALAQYCSSRPGPRMLEGGYTFRDATATAVSRTAIALATGTPGATLTPTATATAPASTVTR